MTKVWLHKMAQKRSVTTATWVPWRGNECCIDFDAMGNVLRDMSWSTCGINPGVMGHQSGWRDVTNQETIKPAQTKLSLAQSLSKSPTGTKEIWPGTQRSLPLQGTEVTVVTERSLSRELRCVDFDAMGNINITPPQRWVPVLCGI